MNPLIGYFVVAVLTALVLLYDFFEERKLKKEHKKLQEQQHICKKSFWEPESYAELKRRNKDVTV